jgi:hypothetical protein
MQRDRSIVRPAALFEFLATATGTGIITTDLRPATNGLLDFLVPTEVKIITNQSARLASAPDGLRQR